MKRKTLLNMGLLVFLSAGILGVCKGNEEIPAQLLDMIGPGNAALSVRVNDWNTRYLSAHYQPPKGSYYVLLPGVGYMGCDVARLSYSVDGHVVTISQTRWLLSVHIDYPEDQGKELKPVHDVENLARQVFKDSAGLKLKVERRVGERVEGTATGSALDKWWQEPDRLCFFLVKIPERRTYELIGEGLAFNSSWFDWSKKQSNLKRRGKGAPSLEILLEQANNKEIVLQELTPVKRGVKENALERTSLVWMQRVLSTDYQPPKGLHSVLSPSDGEGSFDMLRMRYEVGEDIVMITQTKSLFAIQIDRPRPVIDRRGAPPKQVDIVNLARNVFEDAPALEITNEFTAEGAKGGIKLQQETKASWLNGLRWWQDDYQVLFYLPMTDGQSTDAGKAIDLKEDAIWFSK